MTQFKIILKKEKPWSKRQVTVAHGDGYFVSDTDSSGYARFVVYKKDTDGNTHTFLANAHDVLYVLLKPLVNEY